MKKRVLATFISLLMLIASFLAGCAHEEKRNMTLVELIGTVEVLVPGDDGWKELSSGDVIVIGSTLRTGDEAYAHLAINDGSNIGLSPGTELRVLALSPEIQNPATDLELLKGDVFVKVTKALGSGHFTVNTELCKASIVGSVMSVIYDPSGNVIDILCYEGEVEAERGIGAESLTGGNAASISGKDKDSQITTHPIFETQARKTAMDTCWWTKDGHKIAPEEYIPMPSRSPVITPKPTPTPAPTATPHITTAPAATATRAMQTLRPTLAPETGKPLSAEEAANQGTHTYSYTASYKDGASGPASGTLEMSVEFSGNKVTLTSGSQASAFYKVAENTYEAADENGNVVVMEFTPAGFQGSSWGGDWVYTRAD